MEDNFADLQARCASDRPREKLRYQGAGALSDAELLAVLLGKGVTDVPVMVVCDQLLAALGRDLGRLESLEVVDLCKIKGIGEIKALLLLAALELGRRCTGQQALPGKSNEDALMALLQPVFRDAGRPGFVIALMDSRGSLLAMADLQKESDGGLPEIGALIRLCVEAKATQLRPCRSGGSTGVMDSDHAERVWFRSLMAAGAMMGIAVLEILIVDGFAE